MHRNVFFIIIHGLFYMIIMNHNHKYTIINTSVYILRGLFVLYFILSLFVCLMGQWNLYSYYMWYELHTKNESKFIVLWQSQSRTYFYLIVRKQTLVKWHIHGRLMLFNYHCSCTTNPNLKPYYSMYRWKAEKNASWKKCNTFWNDGIINGHWIVLDLKW